MAIIAVYLQIPSQIMHIYDSSFDDDILDLHRPSTEHADDVGDDDNQQGSSLVPKSRYRESLIMFVKEVNSSRSYSRFTHFKSLVEHNSILDVMFTTPVKIKLGRSYELTVTLHQEGYYLVGCADGSSKVYSEANSEGIQFTITSNSDSALISSLIFSN